MRSSPGITVAQAARELRVPSRALYPVARKLVADKQVKKKGAGYSVS